MSNLAVKYDYAEYDALYGRQSLDIKESISIETQLGKCKAFSGERPCKEYFDKGFSGKNTDRPDFQRLIADIKSGIIRRVIVYKIDRISRSLLDFGWIMQLFDEYKVEFFSVNEQFDTSTPIGRAVLNIIMVFAQLERETIQLRTRDNFYARMENSFGMCGVTPFGLKKIPIYHKGKKTHSYEDDPDNGWVLDTIFDWYANEDSATFLNIAQRLTDDESIPRSFNHTQISRIIKNPLYVKADADIYNYLSAKGCKMTNEIDNYIGENAVYLYGTGRREVSKGNFSDEALALCNATLALYGGRIDSKTWLKCQHKMAAKATSKGSGKVRKSENGDIKKTWLIGTMKCAYCGKAMYSNASKNRNNLYLTCYGRMQHICHDRTTAYRLVDTEKYVENKLLEFLKQRADIKAESEIKENSKTNNLKIEITKIDTKIDNLLEAIADDDDVSMVKTFKEKIAKLNAEKSQKMLEMSKLTSNQSNTSLDDLDVCDILKNWHDFDREVKQRIVKSAIETVLVSNEGIDIIFH